MYNHQMSGPINMDQGPHPFVADVNKVAVYNDNYRTTLWTGPHSQMTVMSIPVGDDIGLEVHPDNDQMIRIEDGSGIARLGNAKNNLYINQPVYRDSVAFVPAGTWHNVVNIGNRPLKVSTIYGPSDHPWGTVDTTKAIAEAKEK